MSGPAGIRTGDLKIHRHILMSSLVSQHVYDSADIYAVVWTAFSRVFQNRDPIDGLCCGCTGDVCDGTA